MMCAATVQSPHPSRSSSCSGSLGHTPSGQVIARGRFVLTPLALGPSESPNLSDNERGSRSASPEIPHSPAGGDGKCDSSLHSATPNPFFNSTRWRSTSFCARTQSAMMGRAMQTVAEEPQNRRSTVFDFSSASAPASSQYMSPPLRKRRQCNGSLSHKGTQQTRLEEVLTHYPDGNNAEDANTQRENTCKCADASNSRECDEQDVVGGLLAEFLNDQKEREGRRQERYRDLDSVLCSLASTLNMHTENLRTALSVTEKAACSVHDALAGVCVGLLGEEVGSDPVLRTVLGKLEETHVLWNENTWLRERVRSSNEVAAAT